LGIVLKKITEFKVDRLKKWCAAELSPTVTMRGDTDLLVISEIIVKSSGVVILRSFDTVKGSGGMNGADKVIMTEHIIDPEDILAVTVQREHDGEETEET